MCIWMLYAYVVYMPYHWIVRMQRTAVLVQLLISLILFDISKFSFQDLSWQLHHKMRPRNINPYPAYMENRVSS